MRLINIDLRVIEAAGDPPSGQECTQNRRVLCTNIVLDKAPEPLVQRIANKVYESCRSEQLKVVGFPNYAPLVQAIQNLKPTDSNTTYEVTIKKHDRLVVLQSLAAKWMSSEFRDETTALLERHNQDFNLDGEYWHEEDRPIQHAVITNHIPITS